MLNSEQIADIEGYLKEDKNLSEIAQLMGFDSHQKLSDMLEKSGRPLQSKVQRFLGYTTPVVAATATEEN